MADLDINSPENRSYLGEVLRQRARRGSPPTMSGAGLVIVDRIFRRPDAEADSASEAAPPQSKDKALADRARGDRLEQIMQAYPYAPQGVGEIKHAAMDKKRPPELSDVNPSVPRKPEPQPPQEQIYRYQEHSRLDASLSRRRMEDRVRRSKRVRSPCPFVTSEKLCSKPFIRCGDRLQYSVRESAVQRSRMHHCTYDPARRGGKVLIVDDDPQMRDFCRSSFSLFLHYEAGKVLTAGSVGEAIEIMRRSKVAGDRIGLVITDLVMPDQSGYDLVDELYYRNFDVEVLVMSDENEHPIAPSDYKGNTEILPNLPFVGGRLTKPFHSQRLINTIRRLEFSRHL
ncbi:MAG: response regulator [Chitinivibrionales bacterium]|nr:response regulator [Chitinivibrionales bacterium]MBD3355899.1 response regulator [Chitinivibrionales bacterium]